MFKNNFFLPTTCRALKKGTRYYGACSKTQTAVYTVSGIFSNSFKMSQLYGCRHFEVVLLIFFCHLLPFLFSGIFAAISIGDNTELDNMLLVFAGRV